MHYTAEADTSINVPDKSLNYIAMFAKPVPAMAMPMAEYPCQGAHFAGRSQMLVRCLGVPRSDAHRLTT